MPIFGLPFDPEELRRRALTPGINPNAPSPLPNIPAPNPRMPLPVRPPEAVMSTRMPGPPGSSPLPETAMGRPNLPLPAPGIPGGTGMPPIKQPTRADQYREAKDVYMMGTPGRGKSALLGALQGGLRGLAQGGLGGAAGGALGGALGGGVNPRGLREAEFNQRVRPEILEGFTMEDQDRAGRIQAAKAAAEQAMTQAQLENINSQIRSRQSGDELARGKDQREANQPLVYKPGDEGFDPKTRERVFKIPGAEKSPTAAELTVEPSSGKSFEQIADESYSGRGGDDYVFKRLPTRTQQLISGQIRDAAPAEIEAANRAYQTAIERQRKTDLDYTRGDVRARALGAKKGGGSAMKTSPRKGQPGRRAISVAEAAELLK